MELYSVNLDGTGLIKVSGSLVTGGDVTGADLLITPDSSRVVFRADAIINGVVDLYSVKLDGTGLIKLNNSLTGTGNIYKFLLASDRIIYQGDQDVLGQYELYSVKFDGSGRVKLNGTVSAGGIRMFFSDFKTSNDGTKVFYRADQETLGKREVYMVQTDGTNRRKVSGDLDPGVDVFSFRISNDASWVAYARNVLSNRDVTIFARRTY